VAARSRSNPAGTGSLCDEWAAVGEPAGGGGRQAHELAARLTIAPGRASGQIVWTAAVTHEQAP